MGIELTQYSINVDHEPVHNRYGLAGFQRSHFATFEIKLIASDDDIDRLIDILEQVTGQRPPGYERERPAARPELGVGGLLLPVSTDGEMTGEVVDER